MEVIIGHASDLSVSKGREIDRTEALEHIIQVFSEGQKSIFSKVRRRFHPKEMLVPDAKQKPLFTFVRELEHEQLLEALR